MNKQIFNKIEIRLATNVTQILQKIRHRLTLVIIRVSIMYENDSLVVKLHKKKENNGE